MKAILFFIIFIAAILLIYYLIYGSSFIKVEKSTTIKNKINTQNLNKNERLRNKYKVLIDLIMARNSYYKLNEINSNNIQLTNTGMIFNLTEVEKKLKITWDWNSFGSGKVHNIQWDFHEDENQQNMYEILNKDITIQSIIDEGMTKPQAEHWLQINVSNDEEEQEKLMLEFANKYPELWSKITG